MWVTCRHQLEVEEGRVRCHYVKNKQYKLVISINEYFAAASLLTLHGNNIEYSDKQDIFPNTEFEAIITSVKKNFFHQRMMNFVNKIELSDQKYQTNGNVRNENYKLGFELNFVR